MVGRIFEAVVIAGAAYLVTKLIDRALKSDSDSEQPSSDDAEATSKPN